MILLDTDHLSVLKYTDSERYARLHGRLLAAAPELIGTTIVIVPRNRECPECCPECPQSCRTMEAHAALDRLAGKIR